MPSVTNIVPTAAYSMLPVYQLDSLSQDELRVLSCLKASSPLTATTAQNADMSLKDDISQYAVDWSTSTWPDSNALSV